MKPETKPHKLRFGLLINPFAGIGGKVGLKGSDGIEIRTEAFARGATQQAENRTMIALRELENHKSEIEWFTVSGDMGEQLLKNLDYNYTVIHSVSSKTSAQDTLDAVEVFNSLDLDLLVFAGGDGTARNVCDSLKPSTPVLGIPAGVKIHSGVYAISPNAASQVLKNILDNQLVSTIEASVMDIDEDAFRAGAVKAKQYGTMWVPAEHEYIQSTKVSSSQFNKEDESLVQMDIAEYVVEQMDDDYHYLVGSGTSCAAIMDALDLPNTLLGIDWVHKEGLLGRDLNEQQILDVLKQHPGKVKIIVTIIGGQGHVIGRGNQQLSAKVLSNIQKESLWIIATKTKINQLDEKPLIIDSDSLAINQKFAGLVRVITGFEDEILYKAV